MSLLPLEVIDVYRDTIDRVIEIYGFDCDVYIPKPETLEQAEGLDIYAEKPDTKDHTYDARKSKVFIEWKPDQKRLRRLGVFTEDSLPIVAWFKGTDGLVRNSWIKIDLNLARDQWATDEFELVDCVVKNTYNASVVQAWIIAPRRK